MFLGIKCSLTEAVSDDLKKPLFSVREIKLDSPVYLCANEVDISGSDYEKWMILMI